MEDWKLRDPNLGTMAPGWPKNGLAVAVQNAFVGLLGSGTGSPGRVLNVVDDVLLIVGMVEEVEGFSPEAQHDSARRRRKLLDDAASRNF